VDHNTLDLAKQYILDALYGRQLQLTAQTAQQRSIATVLSKGWYVWLIRSVIITQMTLIYWEHNDGTIGPTDLGYNNSTEATIFRAFILFTLLVDLGAELYCRGAKLYFQSTWNIFYSATLVAMVLTAWGKWYYYLACLRPVLVITKSKSLKRIFTTIVKTLPNSRNVTLLFFTILFVYAGIGQVLFRGLYDPGSSLNGGLNNGKVMQREKRNRRGGA
jgi:hypothetical protein